MKNIFKSITAKVIGIILFLTLELTAISSAFWLMNQANTIQFVTGIILGITSIVAPIEVLIRYIKKQKNK
jgi:hypothetical protein